MRAILDTSVLIGADVPALDGELAISTTSVAELHYGVLVASDREVRGERLRRLTALRSLFDPLPVDDAAAAAGRGRSPRPRSMGLLVAATAHAYSGRLHSRNAAALRGLEREIEIVAV